MYRAFPSLNVGSLEITRTFPLHIYIYIYTRGTWETRESFQLFHFTILKPQNYDDYVYIYISIDTYI